MTQILDAMEMESNTNALNNINSEEKDKEQKQQEISNTRLTVRSQTMQCLELIHDILEGLSKLYDFGESKKAFREYQTNSTASHAGVRKRDIDRFFSERRPIMETVDDTASDLMFAVYKIVFKHWSEGLRLLRIPKTHCELIETDIEYIRGRIYTLITTENAQTLEIMLDEIENSAQLRCPEKQEHTEQV
ncbi:hypothetical protein RFI_28775 [Reticulomyxa filosa]|uniref:Vacuolar protein sorting-associated protein 51 homolog n=1 Tax=Reticulomyxa filosa TaxID=46433 RepID=X6M6G1_RETFI|nr:hypothetical protein RFI_28775 [Reticulomyxa filosa]|eukprot:ETO08615.1 hypothetical protein RFI_28775 [Reticulomyxa filosa]